MTSIISNVGKDVPFDYTLVLCGFSIEGCWTDKAGKAFIAFHEHQFIYDRRRIESSFRMSPRLSQISLTNYPEIIFRVILATDERSLRGYGDNKTMFMSFLHESPDHNIMILEQCISEFLGQKKLGDLCDY